MKILAFSDTHGETDFSYLDKQASEADVILHAGDFTFFEDNMEEVLEGLNEFGAKHKKKIFVTHGNHEDSDIEDYVNSFENLIFLHKTFHETDELVIHGYGGGGFAREEPDFEDYFNNAPKSSKLQIWCLHAPPYDMEVDIRPGWPPTGSKSRARMIKKHNPTLVICGHIHDSHGASYRHKKTLVINPGPDGMVVDI